MHQSACALVLSWHLALAVKLASFRTPCLMCPDCSLRPTPNDCIPSQHTCLNKTVLLCCLPAASPAAVHDHAAVLGGEDDAGGRVCAVLWWCRKRSLAYLMLLSVGDCVTAKHAQRHDLHTCTRLHINTLTLRHRFARACSNSLCPRRSLPPPHPYPQACSPSPPPCCPYPH